MATKKHEFSALDAHALAQMVESLTTQQDKDVAIQFLVGVVTRLQKSIEDLSFEIQHLKRVQFGRKSEKVSTEQLSLFTSMLDTLLEKAPPSSETPSTSSIDAKTPSPSTEDAKKPFALQPTEPPREILVPDEQRACPACRTPRSRHGYVSSIVVEFAPPKFRVIEYRREKIICRKCQDEIQTAPLPSERVLEGARPGPRLLTELVTNKVVDGLPLNRTQKRFIRHGMHFPIQTLNRWEEGTRQLLRPLTERIEQLVLQSDVINLDDTSLRVKHRKTEGGVKKGRIWVFIGRTYSPDGDLSKTQEWVSYMYAKTWEAKWPQAYLKGSKALLQGDAYRGYARIADENLGDGIGRILAGCFMHARRPFYQAHTCQDPAATYFVERFQRIYRFEAEAKQAGLKAPERLAFRKQYALPLFWELLEQAEKLQRLPLMKPMKQGVTYLLNQRARLLVPIREDGRLELDNGSAERRLRKWATGRHAWLFAGSPSGAEKLCDLFTLVSTAESARVEPGQYLADILPVISQWPNRRLDDLLPANWANRR